MFKPEIWHETGMKLPHTRSNVYEIGHLRKRLNMRGPLKTVVSSASKLSRSTRAFVSLSTAPSVLHYRTIQLQMAVNYHLVLKSRPGVNGVTTVDNFEYQVCDLPTQSDLTKGKVILKTLYLSVDPALRSCLNETTGVNYLKPWPIGETVNGLGGIGVVTSSMDDSLKEGDLVVRGLAWPWQLYFVTEGSDLQKVDKNVVGSKISIVLSCLGLIGLTSLLGIWEKGKINREAQETIVVSGAAGACGTLAGQIARLEGCSKVIGICGSDEKCNYVTSELGFDAAINYKTENVSQRLSEVCPNGIDIYFDNVGGDISNSVIKLMNAKGRVVLCGQISQYNKEVPYPPPLPKPIEDVVREKQIERERYLVLNYEDKHDQGLKQLAFWLSQGKLKVRETIEEGLENTGKAFVKMMTGGNIGKQLVHVSDP